MSSTTLESKGKNIERATTPSIRPNAREILDSVELTTAFLEGVPEDQRDAALNQLVEQFMQSSQGAIDSLVQQQELLYIDLIQKGQDGYLELRVQISANSELSDAEKKLKLQDLHQSYTRSKQLRQMVRAQAVDELLARLTNPYLWTRQALETYGYHPGFETGTTLADEAKGKYQSAWDARVHFHKHWGKFISTKDAREIQKLVEGFFEQTHQVRSLEKQVKDELGRGIDTKSYDPKAAEIILLKLNKLPDGLGLSKYTRVVVDIHAISIVLSDHDYDLVAVHGEKKESLKFSGGLHFADTVLNIVRDNYRTDKIISHENEHVINDILLGLHTMNMTEEATGLVASFEAQKNYSERELEQVAEQLMGSMFEAQYGSSTDVGRFADEVLANKLGNQDRENNEILDILNKKELYDDINITDKNIVGWQVISSEDIYSCLFGYRSRFSGRRPGLLEKMAEQPHIFSTQIVRFLSAKEYAFFEDTIKKRLNKDTISAMRQTAIEQVERLIAAGTAPEKIRALLSANNPFLWKEIVDRFLEKRDILAEDKATITQSFRHRAKVLG